MNRRSNSQLFATIAMLAATVVIAPKADAQSTPLINVTYHYGDAAASASASVWQLVSSGGGRGSHNYHEAPITKQSQSASTLVSLNQSSGLETATENYFIPACSASASSSNTLLDTPTQAVYTVNLSAGTILNATQVPYQYINLASTAYDEVFFTLSSPASLSFTGTISPGFSVTLTNQTSGDAYSFTTGTNQKGELGPGSYLLRAFIEPVAYQDTYTPNIFNTGSNNYSMSYSLTITAPTGGSKGSGGSSGSSGSGGSSGGGGSDDNSNY
jgi:hypothetical protein